MCALWLALTGLNWPSSKHTDLENYPKCTGTEKCNPYSERNISACSLHVHVQQNPENCKAVHKVHPTEPSSPLAEAQNFSAIFRCSIPHQRCHLFLLAIPNKRRHFFLRYWEFWQKLWMCFESNQNFSNDNKMEKLESIVALKDFFCTYYTGHYIPNWNHHIASWNRFMLHKAREKLKIQSRSLEKNPTSYL